MFVRVTYFGSYPLGSDIELNDIKIMQCEWNEYRKLTFIYGKKTVASLMGLHIFYVIDQMKIVFFAAHEYRLGHYHIFAVNQRTNDKLSKNISVTSSVHICQSMN